MGWTVRDFLVKNTPTFHHKINEKDLLKGLQEHAGKDFCVDRGVARWLKVILKKEKMVKNILERPKHSTFIDKVRSCAPLVPPTQKNSPVTFLKEQVNIIEESKKSKEEIVGTKLSKRKITEDLSSSGKRYRLQKLSDVIDQTYKAT